MINRKPCICYICRKTIQKGQPKKREHKQNFSHIGCERKPKPIKRTITDKIIDKVFWWVE